MQNLSFFVIFSMVVFQEMCCGPVDTKNSEVNSLLKLLFGDDVVPVKEDKAVLVSSYSNFVNHGGYVPVYKNKFKPIHNDDNFDYLDYSKEYIDEKGELEDRNNDKYALSWLKTNHQADSTPNNNKRQKTQYWENLKQFRDSREEDDSDSNSEEDSKESYLNSFEYGGYHKSDYHRHGLYGQHFGHNHGYHHPGYNHNHGFHNHEHTSDCYFPFGDHGRRRPRPPPPPPGPRPTPPPTSFPTIIPTATNPPATATPVIDPRQTTMASIVSTTYPAIDIRFGGRSRRGSKNE